MPAAWCWRLKEIVQDYSPSAHLLKRLIESRDQHVVS